jgi:hypothetical protein
LEAKVAVWIVSDPRPEHIRAVSWLNESSSASFYLVRVEAIQIEDSAPAPLLTPIVGPTAEAREIGATKQELAGRYKLRHAFWESLLVRAKEKTRLHAARSPGKYHYIPAGAGKRGLSFNYVIHKHDSQVELYIDRGQEAGDENTAIFEALQSHREKVQRDFGEPLEWQLLEEKRACRIRKDLPDGGYRDETDDWPEIQDRMIDAMIRLERALRPYIDQLSV